jgi:NADP-dependent 3-hydroxy acid dehydrogenase YdfG
MTTPERWETTMEDDGGRRRRLGRETALGGLLTADQVAVAIVWAISQPSGVDVNTVIVRPTGQPG